MTAAQLTRRCKLWMRRMGLDEWIKGTTIAFATAEEMGEVLYGCVSWATQESRAEVSVARLEDLATYNLDEPALLVLDKTIVHELLHLSLEGHKPPSRADDDLYERGLNRITDAIVDAWQAKDTCKKKKRKK